VFHFTTESATTIFDVLVTNVPIRAHFRRVRLRKLSTCYTKPNCQWSSEFAALGVPGLSTSGIAVAPPAVVARSCREGVIVFRTHGVCASEDAREDVMTMLISQLRMLAKDESGQDLLEYALLVALIALVAFGAVAAAGTQVNAIFNSIANQLSTT
jgi:pilus assembly protein Flp/PilA